MKGNNPDSIQVMLISPIPSLRVGLKAILENLADIEIVGEAASLDEPGVLPLSDLVLIANLENPSNAWINQVLEENPHDCFLFLVNPPFTSSPFHLNNNRPSGFISLDASAEEVASAIRALYSGLWVIAPELFGQMIRPSNLIAGSKFSADGSSESGKADTQPYFVDALTPRETDVLQCLAQGMANKEIAKYLSISEHTVKYHITSIYSKLGVNNRTEAVRQGIIHGIIVI